MPDRRHPTTFALALGVVGGLAWIGADLGRRVAFTGYGQPGALDYGLTNTLLGGSVILADLGTAGAVWRIRSSIGLVGSISGWIAVAGCALLAAGSLARTHSEVATPSDLQIDDITVAVANISRLVEDGSQRPPVLALWGGVLRVLSAEVRSREARR